MIFFTSTTKQLKGNDSMRITNYSIVEDIKKLVELVGEGASQDKIEAAVSCLELDIEAALDEEYDDGHTDGYNEAEYEIDDRYDEGYDDGYDEGYQAGIEEGDEE